MGGIDGFERGGPGGFEIGQGVGFAVEHESGFLGGLADGLGIEGSGEFLGVLDEEGKTALGEEFVRIDFRSPAKTDAVAEGHLGKGRGDAGGADVMERKNLSCRIELVELIGALFERFEIRELLGVAGDFY